jgi:hypothetical protein
MKRLLGLAALLPIAFGAVACVPPNSVPTHTLAISPPYSSSGGQYTIVGGTITNTGKRSGDFGIEMISSTGQTSGGYAFNVLPGQTAIWSTRFNGTVGARLVRVSATAVEVPWIYGTSAITSVGPSASGGYTEVYGKVTHTGPAAASYGVELKASSGEVGGGYAFDVLPGQTATWNTIFLGSVSVKFVRLTN